jgi:hypothetical protein
MIDPSQLDAVQCCVQNSMCHDNNQCDQMMAQRCARQWDDSCSVYLQQKDDTDINGDTSAKFLHLVADAKYCRFDTTDNTSHCITKCEGNMCVSVDSSVYKDPSQLYSIGQNFQQNAQSDKTVPLIVGQCKKTCDVLNLSNFGPDDQVINECLSRGVCQPVMTNLALHVKAQGIKVDNPKLQKFINNLVVDESSLIQQKAQVNGSSPVVTVAQAKAITSSTLTSQTPAKDDKVKEGFNFMPTDNPLYRERFDLPQTSPNNPVETNEVSKSIIYRLKEYFKNNTKVLILILILLFLLRKTIFWVVIIFMLFFYKN